jgi:hypothetical protein
MVNPHLGSLPDGTRGFDANGCVSAAAARAGYTKGYRFAIRYVRRESVNSYDITAGEVVTLLEARLGIALVQHVAKPGWYPTAARGMAYGKTAAKEARAVGYLAGAHLWCDLEGVSACVSPADTIAFCNAWYDAAGDAGYLPGLYVGDSAGLTGAQLYRALKFAAFWSAYNLNRDMEPIARGVMMRQRVAHADEFLPGFTCDNFDTDVITADAFRSTPILTLP